MRKLAFIIAWSLLAACDAATPAPLSINPSPTPPPSLTLLAATPGEKATFTSTPEAGFTLLPSTPLVPNPNLAVTPTPCTNNAAFIADITLPDNSEVLPGAAIDKRWKVKNTGTCNWNREYRLAFIEGNQLGAAGELAIYPAKAETEAIIQINMLAPDIPGDYTSRWQLRDPDGKPFGHVLFIKIVVVPLASPAP